MRISHVTKISSTFCIRYMLMRTLLLFLPMWIDNYGLSFVWIESNEGIQTQMFFVFYCQHSQSCIQDHRHFCPFKFSESSRFFAHKDNKIIDTAFQSPCSFHKAFFYGRRNCVASQHKSSPLQELSLNCFGHGKSESRSK